MSRPRKREVLDYFEFDATAWLTSPAVIAMHPMAEGAFIHLLAIEARSKDCTLPNDETALRELSRLGSRACPCLCGNQLDAWALYGPAILREFEPHPKDSSRLVNGILYRKWRKAWSEYRRVCKRNRDNRLKGAPVVDESLTGGPPARDVKKEKEKEKKTITATDPPSPPAHAGGPPTNCHGRQTKAEQDQTVRELSAYWRRLGCCDPRAPGGWTKRPATAPSDSNVRGWKKALRHETHDLEEIKAGIAERVRKDLTQLGIPVWDVEPWPPPEFTPEESLRLAQERLRS